MAYVAYVVQIDSFPQNEVPMSDNNDHPSIRAQLCLTNPLYQKFFRNQKKVEITKFVHALYRKCDTFAGTEEKLMTETTHMLTSSVHISKL